MGFGPIVLGSNPDPESRGRNELARATDSMRGPDVIKVVVVVGTAAGEGTSLMAS